RWLALDSYRQVPEEWELTAGSVRFSSDERAAVLGDKTQRSALSQVVAVSGGCRYVLTVVARGVPDAAAELLWRGESCSGVRIDRLPLDPVPAASGAGRTATAGPLTVTVYRLVTDAPPQAGQVEVRLRAPSAAALLLTRVSLQATDDAVTNGDMLEPGDAGPAGWTLSPADATISVEPGTDGPGRHNRGAPGAPP